MALVFAKDCANARCYSVISDGSTDSAVIEQELVYALYLLKDGVPIVKYLFNRKYQKWREFWFKKLYYKSISKVRNYHVFRTIAWFKF